MKALTVHQPWAWLIMAGLKRAENRPWSTGYRGPLAIHAGARAGAEKLGLTAEIARLRAAGYPVPDADELVYGAIVGVVDLVDVVPFQPDQPRLPGCEQEDLAADPLAMGPFCWVLADPRPLPQPIPCRGQQGLWPASAEAIKAAGCYDRGRA